MVVEIINKEDRIVNAVLKEFQKILITEDKAVLKFITIMDIHLKVLL